jgi:hypothetical protein
VKYHGNLLKNHSHLQIINKIFNQFDNHLEKEKQHLLELVTMFHLNYYKNKHVVMRVIYGH